MSITTVFFDLDGTLLPMDQELFVKDYLARLSAVFAPRGFDPKALVENTWKGTMLMVQNNGSQSNESVFWDYFASVYGKEIYDRIPEFDAFYETEFQKVQGSCGYTPRSAQLIARLHEKGIATVLATNPIFPAVATESRIRWAGLKKEDFLLRTTYENSSFCKPNPAYYQSICDQLHLKPENCLMVGNDAHEDMAAGSIGMKVFLLTDCLINSKGKDISAYPQGGFDELDAYLQTIC